MDQEVQYEVVISGISGKFPSADDVEQLKEKLLEQRNLVNDENCRWNKGFRNFFCKTYILESYFESKICQNLVHCKIILKLPKIFYERLEV